MERELHDVTVVVVNYCSSDVIEQFHGGGRLRLPTIVVDNFSDDNERRLIAELCARERWTLLPLPDNRGFGEACNAGAAAAAAAGARFVLFLNPDASIEHDGIAEMRNAADAGVPPALVAPVIQVPSGAIWFQGGTFNEECGIAHHLDAYDPARLLWLTAACLLAPVEHFLAIGGFSTGYFLYWEDVDLSSRWVASGGTLVLCEQATAVHQVGGTQAPSVKGGGKSPTYIRYNVRNRLLYARTNRGRKQTLEWIRSTPAYVDHLKQVAQIGGHPERKRPFYAAVVLGLAGGLSRVALRNPFR